MAVKKLDDKKLNAAGGKEEKSYLVRVPCPACGSLVAHNVFKKKSQCPQCLYNFKPLIPEQMIPPNIAALMPKKKKKSDDDDF